MKPASWTEALIGICCLLIPLWLVPEVLLGFIDLYWSSYEPSFIAVWSTVSLSAAFLLFGSVGMGLLTGEYHKHRKAFHWMWLSTATFATVSILWIWANNGGTP